jgi:serine/threonine-protein kinase HipA|nr:HipA N-terminal domain-containing protein [Candidatus Krumholzibacteria bacterium]
MREARILVHGKEAATLTESDDRRNYQLTYAEGYHGPPISLTLRPRTAPYTFDRFPSFFDGLLPEGSQLDALLRIAKLDRDDHLGQLLVVGGDLVGAVTVLPMPEDQP